MRLGPFSIEWKSLSNPTDIERSIFNGAQPGQINRDQALCIPAVSAAIRTISEAAASLDVAVVQVADDGTETPAPEHAVAKLLTNDVNDWTSGFDLIRDLVASALTDDKGGMAWVNRVNEKPAEIIRYSSSTFTVSHDSNTGEPSYKLGDRDIARADVIHVRSPFAQSPLTLAMNAATTAWHLEQHAQGLFKNGARPAMVVRFKKFMGEEAVTRFRKGWDAVFGGSQNAGRTAVVWDDGEVDQLTMTSTDAQFIENRKFQILEICRAFRIPPSMVFELDRATWSNGEQQAKEFLSYCLEPWLRSLETAMRRALFSEEERPRYRIVFDRDDLSRVDLQTRATAINSLIASETICPNEGRHWLGMSSYKGGETFGNRNITVDPKKPAKPDLQAVA